MKTKPATIDRTAPRSAGVSRKDDVQSVLAALKRLSQPRIRKEMSSRYGIETPNAFGGPMRDMQHVAKGLGRNHALAVALWKTGQYEARTVAAFVADPARVTPALMDRWCRNFDNWAICDTVCFHLFDHTPHAFDKIAEWAVHREEFPKRAAFALLACVALHNPKANDDTFLKCLSLLETASTDDRNFVKKAVSWALRAIGGRNAALRDAATTLARRLASAADPASRWVGKDALRALQKKARP